MFRGVVRFIAPEDKDKWHIEKDFEDGELVGTRQLWHTCFKTWRDSSFHIELLNDSTDLDNLIRVSGYEDFFEILDKLPNIYKIDFSRYLLMYYKGGGYADMDIMVMTDFRHLIENDLIYLMGRGTSVQTSMFFSPKRHKFWGKVIKEAKSRIEKNFDKIIKATELYSNVRPFKNSKSDLRYKRKYRELCGETVGAKTLKYVYDRYKGNDIRILPDNLFNLSHKNDFCFTRHFCTGLWRRTGRIYGLDTYDNNKLDNILNLFRNGKQTKK